MTLVGSQQRFGGSEATCQRTTFPYFLIRNNIVSISFLFFCTTNQFRELVCPIMMLKLKHFV